MKQQREPVTVRFGDIARIKATRQPGSSYVTIPKQHILKLLDSGKVRVECSGEYTDDYAWDASRDYGVGPRDPKAVANDLRRYGYNHMSAWYCPEWVDIHGKERPAYVHFGRHLNEGYRLMPIKGSVSVEARS